MNKSILSRDNLGHTAQKHEALTGHPIEEVISAKINRDTRKILMDFLQEIRVHLKSFEKIDLKEYDNWCKISHSLLPHSPSSLSDIFPVSLNRNVEFIFDKVKQSNSEIGLFLKEYYENAKGENKKEKAKNTMAELQTQMDRFSGKVLSNEDFETLSQFQDLVEKFEDENNIKRLNEHKKITEIMELVMSIQKFLCEVLDEMRNKDPEWFKENEAAFGEIALFYQNKIVPSSRFLKLVLHNVGEYILNQYEDLSPLVILRNAFQEAVDRKVFNQKICIFRKTKDGMLFEAIKDKICPASNFLANLVLKELKEVVV